ncbi:uncharacterized protein DS421_17g578980 [Arachis hypogaea]|nr:uncharacterized protein DS421_17g578980 [Arachis hypogaea]
MRSHSALRSALVECWRPETHTFHLLVGEVTVTLEDVNYILGLPINGEAVTDRSDSSHQFLAENCIVCFSREPGPNDHVFGKVNIAWVRRCRDTELCDTQESLECFYRYFGIFTGFQGIVGGQPVWHTYTDRCVVPHNTTARKWMATAFFFANQALR